MVPQLVFHPIRRYPILVIAPAICFLAFVGGAFVSEFHLFPYALIFGNAFEYIHAIRERKATEVDAAIEAVDASAKARVTIPAKPAAYDGYTFMTFDSGRPSTARLVDMQGNILHEWHRSFRDIWPNPPHRDSPSPESAIAWRYAQLFPNGDILTTIISHGDTPYGYGLVKLDKDSNVIWSDPDNFNHHFSISAEGNIYGTVHDWRNTKDKRVPGITNLAKRVLEDFIVELSPDGKELARVSLLDALAKSQYRELLNSSFVDKFNHKTWDPTHVNDVEIVDQAFTARYDFMKPGMLLISSRELDALMLLDMSSHQVTWVRRGPWLRQHDPDLLSDGNILLFDNRGADFAGGGSRILEFNPATEQVVWSYTGSPEHPFRSDKMGGQERLPNGNTLISEDDGGRVFEVTFAGEIVWEYRDVRLHHATRVTKSWLQFVPSALREHD